MVDFRLSIDVCRRKGQLEHHCRCCRCDERRKPLGETGSTWEKLRVLVPLWGNFKIPISESEKKISGILYIFPETDFEILKSESEKSKFRYIKNHYQDFFRRNVRNFRISRFRCPKSDNIINGLKRGREREEKKGDVIMTSQIYCLYVVLKIPFGKGSCSIGEIAHSASQWWTVISNTKRETIG